MSNYGTSCHSRIAMPSAPSEIWVLPAFPLRYFGTRTSFHRRHFVHNSRQPSISRQIFSNDPNQSQGGRHAIAVVLEELGLVGWYEYEYMVDCRQDSPRNT